MVLDWILWFVTSSEPVFSFCLYRVLKTGYSIILCVWKNSLFLLKFAMASAMTAGFWDNIYQKNLDVWTNELADKMLLQHLDTLTGGRTGLDILVPLCGKTAVMMTLLEKGHRVVAIEWSLTSLMQFFEKHDLAYDKSTISIGEVEIPVFTAREKPLTIYGGDFFLFQQEKLVPSSFDCVFDHGAIGCFECSKEKRQAYAKIVSSLTKPRGKLLFSYFDYIHSEHPSVPFAITEEEVCELYRDSFEPPELLQSIDAETSIRYFGLKDDGNCLFPIWELSHFEWKIVILEKN